MVDGRSSGGEAAQQHAPQHADQLRIRQRVGIVVVCADHHRHDVVAGIGALALYEVAEVGLHPGAGRVRRGELRIAGVWAQAFQNGADAGGEPEHVILGHAEQFGEDQNGHSQREFPMQVHRLPALQRGRHAVQARCDDACDARPQVVDLAYGEIARDQPAQTRMRRWFLHR